MSKKENGKPITPTFAANRFLRYIGGGGEKTPDGARYTIKAVRSALAGLE